MESERAAHQLCSARSLAASSPCSVSPTPLESTAMGIDQCALLEDHGARPAELERLNGGARLLHMLLGRHPVACMDLRDGDV